MTDFPAAHSMDTAWFAVDADGNIGLFDSGEDGAVPKAAALLGGAAEPNFDALLLYAALVVRRIGAGTWQPIDIAPADHERILVVLAGPATDAIDPADFDVISSERPWAGVSKKPMKAKRISELARTEGVTVITSRALFASHEGLDVFCFGREHGDDPGLYQRTSVPSAPVCVDGLPTPTREAVGGLRVGAPFATSATIHLADHISDDDAMYWEADWTLRTFGAPPATSPPTATSPPRDRAQITIGTWIVLAVLVLFIVLAIVR